MSSARFRELFWLDLRHFLRRPLFWIWIVIVVLIALGMSQGGVQVQSGDADVGGTKAWVTSEFNLALILAVLVPIVYTFFIAVAAGMPLIHADELRIGELIHSTPVRPREYVWSKFLAPLAASLFVLVVHLGCSMICNHQLLSAENEEFIGPFQLGNYLRPALLFAVPTILFIAGITFAAGELTRRPIVVFVLPVAIFLSAVFFFWEWNPSWLDPRVDQLLMALDPTGFRWLNQTFLEVDRGVEFYNSGRLQAGPLILFSRFGFAALGLLAVAWSSRHFARNLRGRHKITTN